MWVVGPSLCDPIGLPCIDALSTAAALAADPPAHGAGLSAAEDLLPFCGTTREAVGYSAATRSPLTPLEIRSQTVLSMFRANVPMNSETSLAERWFCISISEHLVISSFLSANLRRGFGLLYWASGSAPYLNG